MSTDLVPAGTAALAAAAPTPQTLVVPPPAPPQHTNLVTALVACQLDFKPVPKTKTAVVRSDKGNFTYKYADLADILEMASPIMARHGILLRQPIRHKGQALFLMTEIWHTSGEMFVDDGLPLASASSPQAFGSSLTYMRRYGFCTMMGISPDADEDGQLAAADKDERKRGQERTRAAVQAQENAGQSAGPLEALEQPWGRERGLEFDKARREGGWKKDPTMAYVRDVLGVPDGVPAKAMLAQFEVAMRWARQGPPKEDAAAVHRAGAESTYTRAAEVAAGDPPPAPESTSGAAQSSTATRTARRSSSAQSAPASEPSASGQPAKIDGAMKAAFWEAARGSGKGDQEIGRYLEKVHGIKSTAEMLASRHAEAMVWAKTPADGPPSSPEEKRARDGMAILGLNLMEQSELVDHHKGDWTAVADACSQEIARRDEKQP